jgi:hypothetical protein
VAKIGEGRGLDAPSQQGQHTSQKRVVIVDSERAQLYGESMYILMGCFDKIASSGEYSGKLDYENG